MPRGRGRASIRGGQGRSLRGTHSQWNENTLQGYVDVENKKLNNGIPYRGGNGRGRAKRIPYYNKSDCVQMKSKNVYSECEENGINGEDKNGDSHQNGDNDQNGDDNKDSDHEINDDDDDDKNGCESESDSELDFQKLTNKIPHYDGIFKLSKDYDKRSSSNGKSSDWAQQGCTVLEKRPVIEAWRSLETLFYCAQNQVMFILRGLPGSGKTTLAKTMLSLYDPAHGVICSADDYRHDSNGEYTWTPQGDENAHQSCQQKVETQCSLGRHVVIIDNTNLTTVHTRVYCKIACKWNYTVVLLEPNTEWKDNPLQLAKKNTHAVDVKRIEAMRVGFERIIYAHYYAFMFSATNSNIIQGEVEYVFHECAFYSAEFADSAGQPGLFQSYTRDSASSPRDMLHLTTLFTDSGSKRRLRQYCRSPEVAAATGCISDVMVIGFCVTPQCLFARVQLTEQQKVVWGVDDSYQSEQSPVAVENHRAERNIFRAAQNRQKSRRNSSDFTQRVERLSLSSDEDDTEDIIARFSDHLPAAYLVPNFHAGALAHVTLGTRAPTPSAHCADALNTITQLELTARPQLEVVAGSNLLRLYCGGCWVVYLRQALIFPAMFSGYYR